MKIISFITSIVAFGVTLYFLVTDFPSLTTLNGFIYFVLMVILLLICAMGLIINTPYSQKV